MTHEELHNLLQVFHAFCLQKNIDYFAIDNTLVGAVTYNDFVPEATGIEIGMLRTHYNRLTDAFTTLYQPDNDDTLDPYDSDSRLACIEGNYKHDEQWYCATVIYKEQDAPVQNAGKNTAIESPERPTIYLKVYDAVTNDYDLTRFQMFRIKRKWLKGLKQTGERRARLLESARAIAESYSDTSYSEVAYLYGGNGQRIPLTHVSTTRVVAFGKNEVRIPKCTDYWIIENRQEELARAKLIQKDSLHIAKEIDRICRANNIGYFLCSGTLLGAVRSGTFIPWDDDIDIGMLREDYNRFLAVAPKQLHDGFFLQTRQSDPDAPYLFSKLRLNNTEYITPFTEGHDFHPGISVDIFPFDRAPIDSPNYEAHLQQALSLAEAHQHLARKKVSRSLPRRPAKNAMERIGHAIMSIQHALYHAKSLAKTQRAYEDHVTKFNNQSDIPYYASYVTRYTPTRVSDLLPLQDISFEGEDFMAPGNTSAMLTWLFGDDYMNEPPLHEQHGHYLIRWRTLSSE